MPKHKNTDGRTRTQEIVPMMRNFCLRADTVDEATRSIACTIATEEPVLAFDMRRWETVLEILRLDGVELPPDGIAPLLDTHDRSTIEKMLGSTRDFKVVGEALDARNYYADDKGIGDRAYGLAKDGHLRDNSVGYDVLAYTDIEAGESATVNGKTYTAPATRTLRITTAWRIKENSNCPIGADTLAKMRAEGARPNGPTMNHPTNNPKEKSAMDEKLRKYLESHGLRADASEADAVRFYWEAEESVRTGAPSQLDDGTKPAQQATPAQRTEPGADPIQIDSAAIRAQVRKETLDTMAAVRAEEAARCEAIRKEGAEYGVDQKVVTECIEKGLDIAAARGEFLKAVRTSRVAATPGINVGAERQSMTQQHLSCALVLRSGLSDDRVLKTYGEDVVNQTMENLRSVTLMDVCRMACAMNGLDAPYDTTELLRAGFSTGTLPTILGDVAHKMMLKGFGAAGETWRTWAGTKSVSDFRDHNLFRLNINGRLEKIGAGGEVRYFERSQEKTTVAADTYGKNLSITRKDMINDDAGAFADAARILGKKAAQGVSDLVYTILLANVLNDGSSTALFSATAHTDADNNAIVNLLTTSPLNYDNLGAAIKLFRKFREYNGDPIDVNPSVLLVPPELETVARELTSSDATIAWGGDTSTRKGNKNVYKQYALTPVAESRLSNSRFTGYNTADWYLMPAAGDADIVTVAYLNGVQNPTINQYGLTADRLGFIWQVIFDYGAAATDKYAVKGDAA